MSERKIPLWVPPKLNPRLTKTRHRGVGVLLPTTLPTSITHLDESPLSYVFHPMLPSGAYLCGLRGSADALCGALSYLKIANVSS